MTKGLSTDVIGILSLMFKVDLFFYKTSLIWHDLIKLDFTNNCFEKATGRISKIEINSISNNDERKLLVDLNLLCLLGHQIDLACI